MAYYSPSVNNKNFLETLKRAEQDGYERGKQESQKQIKDIGINYFECYENETLKDCSDRKHGEYSILTEINLGNRNDIDALIADKLEVKGEYDKLSEQSRLLLAEQTGLTNENINLREDLQVAQQQLRKGKKVTEKVERANARLARREEKLGRHNKKLKEKLPELKDLLGCGNEQLIPCAKNYIEEHRSIKEKNEQFKLQLGLASDKFKCEDGETPEVCFNRKSIIDTIDLQSAVGALQCNPGQKLADCANRFAEENKKELKETTETSPRATAFLDHDFTREEVVTQLKQVHTLGCLALPFTLPLFVALF